MVDTKDELETIGDYKPSEGDGSSPPPSKKEESKPAPPASKQEESKPAPSKTAPTSSSTQSGGDRVFATPASRKLAEEKNVTTLNSLSVSSLLVLAECARFF